MNVELTGQIDEAYNDKVIRAIQQANNALCPEDREAKYCKMASAPLAFFRGTDHLYWKQYASDERLQQFGHAGTRTWLQGDLHAYNYGSYDNADGKVIYDLNDFDEAMYADYQLDLWRMAASIVLVARQNNDLALDQLAKVVDVFAQTYLDTLTSYRNSKGKGTKIDFSAKHSYGDLKRFLKSVASGDDREDMLNTWAPLDETTGERRFDVANRPEKLHSVTPDQDRKIRKAIAAYRDTVGNRLARQHAYFKVRDVARRLGAGTGSLGKARFYVLIQAGKPDDPRNYRILDAKQQSSPTCYDYLDEASRLEYDRVYGDNHALRHQTAYEALTRRTDPHLGWMYLEPINLCCGNGVRDCSGYYSVRERSPFKEAFPGEVLDTRTAFSVMAEQWAAVIATGHARANKKLPKRVRDRTSKQDEVFLGLVREIAFSCADQVHADWTCFRMAAALKTGECGKQAFVPPSYRDMLPR